jgi:hypothetical protein
LFADKACHNSVAAAADFGHVLSRICEKEANIQVAEELNKI